jgi:hypothetical protein
MRIRTAIRQVAWRRMMNEAIARHGAVRVDTMEEALAVIGGLQDAKGAKPIVIKGKKPDEGEGPT